MTHPAGLWNETVVGLFAANVGVLSPESAQTAHINPGSIEVAGTPCTEQRIPSAVRDHIESNAGRIHTGLWSLCAAHQTKENACTYL